MAIELKGVTKRFGDVTALDNISLCFEENCIYGLLGNNGAGKTTLLNILTNRLYPDSGEVLVNGKHTDGDDGVLGLMFMIGEQNLYPDDMRVGRALEVAAAFYPNFDAEYAAGLAKSFGLGMRKKITALSTGYASIFRLIIALSVNAPYLLLDEPVLGLDAQHRDMFYRALIEKYAKSPCTVVISTHLIQEAAPLIERAVIIREGRLLCDKPVDELLGGVYNVSGPALKVDEYIAGKSVLSQKTIGGLKTACIEGNPEELPNGLELSRVELQDYFINLMNKENEK